MDSYEDIINLPHPVSKRHPQMSMRGRAAQFAPFAALAGHSEAIEETARLTDSQMELADEDAFVLNQKMATLREIVNEHPSICVTYFVQDKRKAGGKYKTIEGPLQNIDDYNLSLVMRSGEAVPLKSVLDIDFTTNL